MVDVVAWFRWLSASALALASVVATADSAAAQERKYAILIGVSYCENATSASLPFVENDVAVLAETLAARGFDVYPFCEASVKLDPENQKIKSPIPPTKANIERAFLEEENGPLKNVFKTKNATLLVYFSGHGLVTVEDSERTRLFMRDSDLQAANRSTLCAQALREMVRATPCERRLLLIDACHAAGTGGAKTLDAYSRLFEDSFLEGGVDGAPTFASCSFQEISSVLLASVTRFGESQRKRDVSVFTYWVNEALKGRADGAVDGKADGVVGSDELFAYVEQNIRWMRSAGRSWQTPAIVASQDEKPFVLCDAPSRGYLETIDDLAEQIVTKAKILGKKEIYVDDFDATIASEALRENLRASEALHSFAVSATEQLRTSVQKKWSALEQGTVTRPGDEAFDRRFVVKTVVEARLGADREIEYAMTCSERNFGVAGTRNSKDATARLASKNAPEAALKGLDDGTRLNAAPMNVRVEARGAGESVWRTRTIREIDGAQWIELNPGETYRVVFEPNVGAPSEAERVCARLLIDGRNSLAQYEPYVEAPGDFGWQIEEKTERAEPRLNEIFNATLAETAQVEQKVVLAPVVPLEGANFWLLNPRKRRVVDGFVDPISQTSDVFRVVETDASGDDERGLILVAFYEAARSRSVQGDAMTEPGPRQKFSAIVVEGFETGAPLGVWRLRYASAEYLARLEEETASSPSGGDLIERR